MSKIGVSIRKLSEFCRNLSRFLGREPIALIASTAMPAALFSCEVLTRGDAQNQSQDRQRMTQGAHHLSFFNLLDRVNDCKGPTGDVTGIPFGRHDLYH